MKPYLHFIHNARTAGNFVKRTVLKNASEPYTKSIKGRVLFPGTKLTNGQTFSSLGHINTANILDEEKNEIFAVVRHPLTRFISCYSHFRKNDEFLSWDARLIIRAAKDISDFVDIINKSGKRSFLSNDQIFRTQTSAIKHFANIKIISFENLTGELQTYLESLKLKVFDTVKVNESEPVESTEMVKDFVESYYSLDYKNFGYQ